MRSWLYVPADKPKMIINAGIYGADGIVFDLEDSVGVNEKDQARILISEAIKNYKFSADEQKPAVHAARINDLSSPFWKDDLEALVPAGVKIFRLPKVEHSDEINEVSELLSKLEVSSGLTAETIKLQIILETPAGIENAVKIAEASSRITGLSFGAEDFCAASGINRAGPAFALDYSRSRIVCAAAACGIEAWDTVWAGYKDIPGLECDAQRARALGFSGKSVIHPSQIEIVNRIFSPTDTELKWAEKIVKSAGSESGAFSVDGMMIDKPVINRALRILKSRDENA